MKRLVAGPLALGLLLTISAVPDDAWARGRGGSHHHGVRHHHGFHHGGHHLHGFRHHGFHHRSFHGRGHFHGGFGVGVFTGLAVGTVLAAPLYAAPPVAYAAPPVYYPAPAPPPVYWYYCRESQAYYPYVQECPGGWLTVVPPGPER
jgi:hypothetical protein